MLRKQRVGANALYSVNSARNWSVARALPDCQKWDVLYSLAKTLIWNSDYQERVLFSRDDTLVKEGVCMQSAAQYRTYAQECRKLAQKLKPEHRDTLMNIADAWDKCADDLETSRSNGGGVDRDARK